MADEYQQRYRAQSHRQLYDAVMAGRPADVGHAADLWRSAAAGTVDLAGELRRDLLRLGGTWTGPASERYQQVVGLVADFADVLAGEHYQLAHSLVTMSAQLSGAQSRAECPEATDDHDKMVDGITGGLADGAWGGPTLAVGTAVVSGFLGYRQDETERRRAHERMVQLVAGLAADYDTTTATCWPATVPDAPEGLPTGTRAGSPTAGGGTAGASMSASFQLGGAGGTGDGHHTGAPTRSATTAGGYGYTGTDPSPTGETAALDPDPGGDEPPGTGLAGVDGARFTGLPGADGLPGGPLAGGAGGIRTGVAPPGMATVGGLAGTGRGPARTGRPGTTTGERTAPAGRRSGVDGRDNLTGRARGSGADDADERRTWLTEDEMIWYDEVPHVPPVIGAPPPVEA